jgi:DNA-binding NarL/FixJ family response regulator
VTETVRVLLVDDHALVRAGLRILIESQPRMQVVGEASDEASALQLADSTRPRVILLDLDLGRETGTDLIPRLLATCPGVRILVLTGVRDADEHRRAVRLGAVGLVQKEMATEVLLKAIEKVSAGDVWLHGSLTANVPTGLSSGRMSARDPEAERIATLTPRERDVVSLIAEGLSNKRIASRLGITDTTVRHHLTSIFGKLGVSDRLELLVYAYRNRLTPPAAGDGSESR